VTTQVLDTITVRVVAALDAGAPLTPAALEFLVRRFRDTGADAIPRALGLPLAAALTGPLEDEPLDTRARWLSALAAVAAVSSDPRIRDAGCGLAGGLQAACTSERRVRAVCSAIAALVEARDLVGPAIAARAIDALEQVVAAGYRPGRGMSAHLDDERDGSADAADQAGAAAALLAAHGATGRLPYAMLADELMQVAFRLRWEERAMSTAVRVCCGLSRLHRAPDFRASAVVSELDYETKADDLIAAMSVESDAAAYGLALAERLDLK
jgi:hypothetical protein